ncbi:MAG: hypothetical protein OEW39_06530, partial [Deltaproteobacteria bacterium]|nr:hypothetical protein [Deltaproteobacteria bacterium]
PPPPPPPPASTGTGTIFDPLVMPYTTGGIKFPGSTEFLTFHKITDLTPGSTYTVSLTSTSTDVGFVTTLDHVFVFTCDSWTHPDYICITPTKDTTLWVITYRMMGGGSAPYTLNITEGGLSGGQGTPFAPIPVAQSTGLQNGFVGNFNSFYEITGLTAGNTYSVTLTPQNFEYLELSLSSDPFQSQICTQDTWNGSAVTCPGKATGSSLWVMVSGELSITGGNFNLSIASGGVISEGTPVAPLSLNLGTSLTYSGTVSQTNHGYYKISGLTPGALYTFNLLGSFTGAANATVHDDPWYLFETALCELQSRILGGGCTFRANGSEVWVRVENWNSTAQSFTLSLAPGGTLGEGSLRTPMSLALGKDLPRTATVNAYANFYAITGLTPGTTYTVTLSGLTDPGIQLELFTNHWWNYECGTWVSATTKSCAPTPVDTTLWVKVIGWTTEGGGSYTLDIKVSPSEGSSANPLSLAFGTAALPHQGKVGASGISYYSITGLAPNSPYTVSLSSVVGDVFLYSHSDAASSQFCSGHQGPNLGASCALRASGTGTLWVEVTEGTNLADASFTLNVAAGGMVSEGSNTLPMSLLFGTAALPHVGQVSTGGFSYYQITGLTPDAPYTASLTTVTGNIYLYSHRDAAGTEFCFGYQGPNLDASCALRASSTGILWVTIEEASYTAGATFTLNVTAGGNVAEGTSITPVQVPLGTSYPGTVNTNVSYYQITGLTAGSIYTVTLSGTTDTLYLSGYLDNTWLNMACWDSTTAATLNCVFRATGTSLWLMVNGFSSVGGDSYTLSSVLGGFVNEGDWLNFIPVTPPYSGSVAKLGSSYYQIPGLTAGTAYTVSVSGLTDDVSLYVFADSAQANFRCGSYNTGTSTESCAAIPTGTSLWVQVDGTSIIGAGTYFTLDIAPGGLAAEGTIIAAKAVAYASLPYTGSVGNMANANQISYYEITGLTAGTAYTVSRTGISSSTMAFYVYTLGGWQTCSNSAALATTSCAAIPTSTSLWVQVHGNSATGGDTFTLNVVPGGLAAEGRFDTPVLLAFGTADLPHNGTVGAPGNANYQSLYQITGLTAATSYTVSLTTMSDNVDLWVYTDAFLTAEVCKSINLGITAESCTLPTSATGTSLWIKVDGFGTTAGASFTLTAQ